ncbi:hypothetical protein AB6A40_011383 [Gnathostoma spinigerum]|uniref:Uncharacterized protein n=1 Tax=Gnathostoma spinigerum TaxID=75299 RepID=A0ABD6EXH4_9BILA
MSGTSPYFANPFVTPFMPQQAMFAAASSTGSHDFVMNPFSASGYFLPNVQYEEMMQQYIQSLMIAASQLPQSINENNITKATPNECSSSMHFETSTNSGGTSSASINDQSGQQLSDAKEKSEKCNEAYNEVNNVECDDQISENVGGESPPDEDVSAEEADGEVSVDKAPEVLARGIFLH